MAEEIKDKEDFKITNLTDLQGVIDDSVYGAICEYVESQEKEFLDKIQELRELNDVLRGNLKRTRHEKDMCNAILSLFLNDIKVVYHLGDSITQKEMLDRLLREIKNTERLMSDDNSSTFS